MTSGTLAAISTRLESVAHKRDDARDPSPQLENDSMNRRIFSKTSSQLIAAAVFSMAIATGVNAQASSGNIMGEGQTGDTIVVESPNTGFHREVVLKENGKYQMRRLPIGEYAVTVKHADGTVDAPKKISINVGVTVRIQ